MISNKLIAIDFGSSRISAMAGEVLENGALRILSEESKPSEDVRWGIVDKPTGASFKVSELLKLLKNSAKSNEISHVSVSLGAKSMKQYSESISRFVGKSKAVTEELLTEMLEECERKVNQPECTVFDITLCSYLVNGVRKDEPIGLPASQITGNYKVVTGNDIIKKELNRCFDRTGIVVEYTPLSVEALSTVLLDDQDKEAGCALINFGATTTTLAAYHDGILQELTIIPLGSKNITKDIQELGISEKHAEKLKCITGSSLESKIVNPVYVEIPSVEENGAPVRISTKFLATIIESRLEEILEPIFNAMLNLSFSLDAGIIITGGGSKLNDLIDYINEKTGIYTRYGDHSEWLSDDTDERFYDPIYAQTVGTLILTHEFRKENPVDITIAEPEKAPKLPKKKFAEKFTNKIFDFFSDDNKLN